MAKYCTKIVREHEEWVAQHGLMEYGGAMLKDFCADMGIHDKTYRIWCREHKEYAEAIERGKESFKKAHTQKLFGSLMEAALGGERETEIEHTEYRPNPDEPSKPMIARMTRDKRKQYIKPDTTAAIFLLCNLDPEHWRQRQDNNIAIKAPDSDNEMSLEEIKNEIKRLTEE